MIVRTLTNAFNRTTNLDLGRCAVRDDVICGIIRLREAKLAPVDKPSTVDSSVFPAY